MGGVGLMGSAAEFRWDRVAFWRKKRNLSQRALGREAGLSGSYIRLLELGEVKRPSIQTAASLALALGLPVSELWPGARPLVQPDDPELLDIIERSGVNELPEPRRTDALRLLVEALDAKRRTEDVRPPHHRAAEDRPSYGSKPSGC